MNLDPRLPHRRRWRAASAALAITVLVGASLGAAGALWGGDLDALNAWSGIVSALIAYATLGAAVVAWAVRRADRRDAKNAADPGRRLRSAVAAFWTQEQVSRQLFLPRPLRLRWRRNENPDLNAAARAASQGAAAAPAGSLRTDVDGTRPAADDLLQAFRDRSLRQVVLVGEAGAGKTTLAMLYVVAAATADTAADRTIAVMVSIAAWDPGPAADLHATEDDIGLETWLAARITENHPSLTEREGAALIADHRIIAVLDGLDELPVARRAAALDQLERASAGGLRMLITCRTADYAAMVAAHGVLPQAVVAEVVPVSADDAVTYLAQREAASSTRWKKIATALRQDPESPVATALSTPLMVSLARQVYADGHAVPDELFDLSTRDAVETRLIERFLPSIYGSARAERAADRLAFLIRAMSNEGDPDLRWWWLARSVPRVVVATIMTAAWVLLGTALSITLYLLLLAPPEGSSFTVDLLGYVIEGGLLGFVVGLAAGLHAARAAHAAPEWSDGRPAGLKAAVLAVRDLCTAAGAASVFGACLLLVVRFSSADLSAALSGGVAAATRNIVGGDSGAVVPFVLAILVFLALLSVTNGLGAGRSGLPSRATPRLRTLPAHLGAALAVGVFLGAPWLLDAALTSAGAIDDVGWPFGLVAAAGTAATVTTIVGLGRWLRSPVRQTDATTPTEVLRRDRAATLLTAVVIAVTAAAVAAATTSALTLGWLPRMVLPAGVGLVFGAFVLLGTGSAWVNHSLARGWLAVRGRVPWRLIRFLDQAHRDGVLRQNGGAYQIRHDLLRRHLLARRAVPRRWSAPAWHRPRPTWRRRLILVTITALACAALPLVAFGLDPFVRPDVTLGDPHPGRLLEAFFSADNNQVVTVDLDGDVRVWNANTGARLAELRDTHALSARLSPDGRFLVTFGGGGPALLADAATGQTVAVLAPGSSLVRSAEFQAVGPMLLLAGDHVSLWDTSTGHQVASLDASGLADPPALMSPRGDRFAVIDPYRRLSLHDARTGRLVAEFGSRTYDGMSHVLFSPDGSILAAVAVRTGEIDVWDAKTGTPLTAPDGGPYDSLTFDSRSSHLVTVDLAGHAQLWSIGGTGTTRALDLSDDNRSRRAVFTPNDRTVVTVDVDGSCRAWDAGSGSLIRDLPSTCGLDVDLGSFPQFSRDGTRMFTVDDADLMHVIDSETGRTVVTVAFPSFQLESFVLSRDGDVFAVKNGDGSTDVWNAVTGHRIARLDGTSSDLTVVGLSGDGAMAAGIGDDSALRLWRLR